MVFSSNKKSNKNEKEKLLDELTRDFGFDKENVDKIMKESPYLDLNDIISNLINDDKNEDDHPNEQDQGNINLAMNEKWEFGSGPSLFPAVPSPFLPPVNIFNPQFSGYGNSFGNQQFNLNTNQNMNIMIEGNNNNINFVLNKGNKEKKGKKGKKEKKEKEENEETLIKKKIEEEEEKIKGKKNKDKKNKKENDKSNEEDEKEEEEEIKEDEKDDEKEENKEEIKEEKENNQIENAEEEENEEDDDDNKNDKIEKEEKNDCFGFENEKNLDNYYNDFEKDLFINTTLDKSNLSYFMVVQK